MLRKIVDYNKLNEDILNLLVEKFPDGYNDGDIITFRNMHNEIVDAVEVRTDEIIYLVKVGKRLAQAMEDFLENDTTQEIEATAERPEDLDIEFPEDSEE